MSTTTIDLDRLEALAKAVKKGKDAADWEFAKAITPAAILELIALARRSQPVAATQQAAREQQEPVADNCPECGHEDWRDFYTGPSKTHDVCATCNYRRLSAPVAQQPEAGARLLALAGEEYTDAGASIQHGAETVDVPEWAQIVVRMFAQPVEAGAPTRTPDGAARTADGTTYHNIAEIYHRFEEGEALHMWLDDREVPRADTNDAVFSLVGRVGKLLEAGAPTAAATPLPKGWKKAGERILIADFPGMLANCVGGTREYREESLKLLAATIEAALEEAFKEGRESAAPGAKQDAPAFDPVVEANRKLLLERSHVGMKKYGTTLAAAGLSRAQLAQHALEEALDLANYLQTIIQTEEAQHG